MRVSLLTDLFLLRPSAYRHAREDPRSHLWASAFLLATGSLYGVLLALFQRALGGEIKGVPVAQIPDTLLFAGNLVSGLVIALVFHGGVTLVVWLMARAVGGRGRLSELYRTTAYVLPLSWPGLPRLSLLGAAQGADRMYVPLADAYTMLGLLAIVLVCCGLYQLFRVTQDFGPGRAASGVFLVVLFCYSVLLVTSG